MKPPKLMQPPPHAARPHAAQGRATPRVPCAPPVYRPAPNKTAQPKLAQPLQPKTVQAARPSNAATPPRVAPQAPPVYRPQAAPHVLQRKAAAPAAPLSALKKTPPAPPQRPAPPATPARAAVQLKPGAPPSRFGAVIQRMMVSPQSTGVSPQNTGNTATTTTTPTQTHPPLIVVVRERDSSTLKSAVGDIEVDDAVDAVRGRRGGTVVEYKASGGWNWSTQVNYVVAHGHGNTGVIGNSVTPHDFATKLLNSGLTADAHRLKLVVCCTDFKPQTSKSQDSFLDKLVSKLAQDSQKRCRGLVVEGTWALVHYTPNSGSYIFATSVAPNTEQSPTWDTHWEVQGTVSITVSDAVRVVAVCRVVADELVKLKAVGLDNHKQVGPVTAWLELIQPCGKWLATLKKKQQADFEQAALALNNYAQTLEANLLAMQPYTLPGGNWKQSSQKCIQTLDATNANADKYAESMKNVASVYWGQKKQMMGQAMEANKVVTSGPTKRGVIKFDNTGWVEKVVK